MAMGQYRLTRKRITSTALHVQYCFCRNCQIDDNNAEGNDHTVRLTASSGCSVAVTDSQIFY